MSNQVAYIQSWLEKLKKDPTAFVTAAARAQKAADFILNRKAAEKPEEAA
jgi:antirestriction protein ArdC